MKNPLISKKNLKIGADRIVIFEPDFPIFWEVQT